LLFQSLLPAVLLNSWASDERKRVYTEIVVFWAWLAQVLNFNASCSKAVTLIRSWCSSQSLPVPSAQTGAYCQARIRLRLEFLKSIFSHLTKILNSRIRSQDLWRGMIVKSIDGSSVQLMDTPENQKAYPQPTTQKKGCGFPVMGVSAVLNHAHGGWEGYVTSPHTENDHKDSSYELMSLFKAKEVHSLMPLHQARKADFRRGKKAGKNQRITTIEKPRTQPPMSSLSQKEWDQLPSTMEVRIIRFYYTNKEGKQCRKHLVTSLLDTEQYPREELILLYLERWDIELRFRDVKTTMKFEALNVKTPEMACKALTMALIGFNLIKAVSQEASELGRIPIREMSFKGVLDEVISQSSNYRNHAQHPHKCASLYEILIDLTSEQRINLRPFRYEPRAIKKRPKPFPRLQTPRSEWKKNRAA